MNLARGRWLGGLALPILAAWIESASWGGPTLILPRSMPTETKGPDGSGPFLAFLHFPFPDYRFASAKPEGLGRPLAGTERQ